MARAALVGEIGLDSVWCDTPMAAQRKVFAAQLDWAAAHGKGIVLHTKGCEMEIAKAVEGFPHPVIVHWYSGGPDVLAASVRTAAALRGQSPEDLTKNANGSFCRLLSR